MFGPRLVRQYLMYLLSLQSLRKRKLVALLELVFLVACDYLYSCLILMVPRIGLQCVIVTLHCHIHFLFY